MDLDDLLDRCRSGDQLAWEQIVRQYQSRVFAIACHYLGDPEEARDVAQEVFVRVYQNIEACKAGQHLLPWLIRISRNLCIDQLRRKKARPPAQDVSVEEMGVQACDAADPEEQARASARLHLLARALRNLTHRNREIILLKEIQGLTFEEIAGLLKVPIGTLKSRSHRARIELAQQFLAVGGESGEGLG